MATDLELLQNLNLQVANARIKWEFGTQAFKVAVPNAAGTDFVAPKIRAPEKWFIFCYSVFATASAPPTVQLEWRYEIPVLEVPNTDEWWDTNTGKAVNKKDLKFTAVRDWTNRSVTHLAFYDKKDIKEGKILSGRIWELVRLGTPFTIGPAQTAVFRPNDLQIYGFDPTTLEVF